jgi:hypothetical protein
MKNIVINTVTLVMISTITVGDINDVYAEAAGASGTGGSTSTGGKAGSGAGGFAGATTMAGTSWASGMAGISGYAGAVGGALVVRRRYVGVHVNGTSWLSSALPIAGLFSLGWLCISFIRKQEKRVICQTTMQ